MNLVRKASTLLATLDAAVKYAELVSPQKILIYLMEILFILENQNIFERIQLPLMMKLQFEKEVLRSISFRASNCFSEKENANNRFIDIWDVFNQQKIWTSNDNRINTRNKTNSHKKRRINGICHTTR